MFGIEAAEGSDKYTLNISKALEGLSAGMVPGKWFVETFPILRYIPAWMPGAGFKQNFKNWREGALAATDETFAFVKDAMVNSWLRGFDDRTCLLS